MRIRCILAAVVCAGVLGLSSSAWAQGTCTASATAYAKNPAKVGVADGQFALTNPDGSAVVASVSVAIARQATPTVVEQTVVIPRAAWTLEAGSTNCYTATLVLPATLARSTGYLTTAILTGPDGTSPASLGSNPFFLAGAPNAPGSIRLVRAIRHISGKPLARVRSLFFRRSRG